MTHDLPPNPNLEHLKKQAKDLLREFQQGNPAAMERFRSVASTSAKANPKLADAQHVIAREYGFESWLKLKQRVESLAANPADALAVAINANDAATVAEVIERFPELKSRLDDPLPNYGFGGTPLIAAVQRTNREMIDVLLRAGAGINARSQWWAGSFGVLDNDRGLAPFLIERGAVVTVHAAARLGMLDKLEQLVSADPDLVHARGGDGQTPLHFACNIQIAEFLLHRGADIDARDIDHESTPAQYMVRERQDVARYLVARGCTTDILMAAALGDLELARKHLDADPACIRMSVSAEYFPMKEPRAGGTIYIWCLGSNKTAHAVAREFGHEDVFHLLMDHSPIELKLALACELGDETIFKSLLAGRPDLVQSLTDDDRRKLVNAAQGNNTAAVRMMLAAGWPVDVHGQHGGTALHWAAWHGNAEMVREILHYHPPLEEGADPGYDGTPLGWAIHGSEHSWHRAAGDYAAVVEVLLQAGAKAPKITEDLRGAEPVRAVLLRYERVRHK